MGLALAWSLRRPSATMTLRIEEGGDGERRFLRLIGQVEAQHLEDLRVEMRHAGSTVGLDLEEVTLVDLEVVRFLGVCETGGTPLVHVPPYVRAWIRREAERPTPPGQP